MIKSWLSNLLKEMLIKIMFKAGPNAEFYKIYGFIYTDKKPIQPFDMSNEFIKWIEANNWKFFGLTGPADKETGRFL